MKKELIGFIAGCAFTATALIGGPALADAYNQNINVQIDSVKVSSAGKDGTEPTILWNNKTYIPMRETLENASCRVTYYDATKSVVVNNRYEKCGDLLSCNGKTLSRDDAIYYWDKDNNMTFYIKANYLIGNCGLNIATVAETYGKTDLPKASKNQNSSMAQGASNVTTSTNNKFSIAAQPMLAYQNELVPASDTVVYSDGDTVICYINPEYLAKKYNMNVIASQFNGRYYPNFVNSYNNIPQTPAPTFTSNSTQQFVQQPVIQNQKIQTNTIPQSYLDELERARLELEQKQQEFAIQQEQLRQQQAENAARQAYVQALQDYRKLIESNSAHGIQTTISEEEYLKRRGF